MNLRDWIFKQLVTQGDMDESWDWAQDADHAIIEDLELTGILSGGNCTENSPADLNILVDGPIVAYDKSGQRTYDATNSQLVDASQDEFSSSTTVTTGGNARWISLFIRFKRRLEDPEIDGNQNEVYTRQYEDAEIFVRQGAEAVTPTRPALMADALLLCDVYRVFGQTTFQNANIDVTRREDWFRFVGASLGTIVHGTPHDAITDIYGLLDTWGGSLPFSFTEDWFGSTSVSGPSPPPTTIQEALDAIVYDLAQSGAGNGGTELVGAKDYTSTHAYISWSDVSLQLALQTITENLDAHINGGAPAHPASGVTTTAIAGTPESIGASNVQSVLSAIYGHLNSRTERAIDETINGAWRFDNGGSYPAGFQDDNVPHFEQVAVFKTIMGGGLPLNTNNLDLETRFFGEGPQPFNNSNSVSFGGTLELVDIAYVTLTGGRRVIAALDATNNRVYLADAVNTFSVGNSGSNLASGLPAPQVSKWIPTAMCADGQGYIYIMFIGDSATPANRTHYIQAYSVNTWAVKAGWPATGTALPGASPTTGVRPAGAPPATGNDQCRVATTSQLVTLNSWVAANASTAPVISLINLSNGVIASYGAGDVTPSATKYATGGLATDSTYIYFSVADTTGPNYNGEICSAQIISLSVGSGLSNFPYSVGNTQVQDLIDVGYGIWGVTSSPTGVYATVLAYPFGTGWVNITMDFGDRYKQGRYCSFDGHNFWFQTFQDSPNSSISYMELVKISVSQLIYEDSLFVYTSFFADEKNSVIFSLPSEGNLLTYDNLGRCAFDGDSVWMIMDERPSQTLSGRLRCIRRSSLR